MPSCQGLASRQSGFSKGVPLYRLIFVRNKPVYMIKLRNQDITPYSCDWSQEIFKVHVPRDSSTHYRASYTVSLHRRTRTLLIYDALTTKPSWRGQD